MICWEICWRKHTRPRPVCMYVCMCIHVFVCVWIWPRAWLWFVERAFEGSIQDWDWYVCAYVCMYMYMYLYVYENDQEPDYNLLRNLLKEAYKTGLVYAYVCMYVYVHVFVYENDQEPDYNFLRNPLIKGSIQNEDWYWCIHVCMYVYMCLYVYKYCICTCMNILQNTTRFSRANDDKNWHTAILIIIEGPFQVFQRFFSSKLVLKTVESCFVALNYCENGSTWCMQGKTRTRAHMNEMDEERTSFL